MLNAAAGGRGRVAMNARENQTGKGARPFNIAIAGKGPLLDKTWRVLSSERFRTAMPNTRVVAFFRRDGEAAIQPGGPPIFASCAEMFAKAPDINMILDVDEQGGYQEELRRCAPLAVNLFTSDAVHYLCRAIENDVLAVDGALRILRMQQSFITMINNLDADALLLDEYGVTLEVNNHFLRRMNGRRKDFIGKPCKELEGEDLCCVSDTDDECPLEKSVRTNSKVTAVYNRVNGSGLQYFRIDVFPLPDELGKPRYMLTRDDVTDLFQLQQRVLQSEKMAAIGELSTYIAHEIRNPLFAIGGFANALLRNPSLDESGREKAGIILEESQRLDGILKSILNFSKPVETDMGEVDIARVAAQTIKLMSLGDGGRNVDTSLEVAENLPHARGNADLLKQCLINIIKNAHEAMPGGGQLSIRVGKAGNMLEILVRDTGCGITEDVLARIFNPFFSTKGKGAGLGLAMTKKLIVEMGGKLELSSTVGQGTTVRVLLLPALALAGETAGRPGPDARKTAARH